MRLTGVLIFALPVCMFWSSCVTAVCKQLETVSDYSALLNIGKVGDVMGGRVFAPVLASKACAENSKNICIDFITQCAGKYRSNSCGGTLEMDRDGKVIQVRPLDVSQSALPQFAKDAITKEYSKENTDKSPPPLLGLYSYADSFQRQQLEEAEANREKEPQKANKTLEHIANIRSLNESPMNEASRLNHMHGYVSYTSLSDTHLTQLVELMNDRSLFEQFVFISTASGGQANKVDVSAMFRKASKGGKHWPRAVGGTASAAFEVAVLARKNLDCPLYNRAKPANRVTEAEPGKPKPHERKYDPGGQVRPETSLKGSHK